MNSRRTYRERSRSPLPKRSWLSLPALLPHSVQPPPTFSLAQPVFQTVSTTNLMLLDQPASGELSDCDASTDASVEY